MSRRYTSVGGLGWMKDGRCGVEGRMASRHVAQMRVVHARHLELFRSGEVSRFALLCAAEADS